MTALALIPARGGSKGLPRKNTRLFGGKPLVAWSIEAAQNARAVARVVVSTDDPEIAAISRSYGAEVVQRPAAISGDLASSEAALLHALERLGMREGRLAFLQCTAPLTLPEDIDGTLALLERADTAFTATPWHGFPWLLTREGALPLGHSRARRPMRQERADHYLEVGAVYALTIAGFLREKRRFFGRTEIYTLPRERSIEIDDETDFALAEMLLRRRLDDVRAREVPEPVQAVVMDFDGVLTDNRVHVDERGGESVVCHRGDGWALARLREAGIKLMVLTNEANPAVAARCRKLGVERVVADGDKLPHLVDWLRRNGVDPRATLYIGNDLPDVPCMCYCGCAFAPRDAEPCARAAAQVVLDVDGGRGCIRALAQFVL